MRTRTNKIRRWQILALLGVLVLSAVFLAISPPELLSRVDFDATNWRVYVAEAEHRGLQGTKQIVTTRHFGPVLITTERWDVDQSRTMRRTNELRVGMILYSGFEHNLIGRILRTEDAHGFEDGTVGPGVLVRTQYGSERWYRKKYFEDAVPRR